MAFQLEKHVGEVLGPYSKGLVSIGLAESLFEKGGNIYKVLELANRGLMETMNGASLSWSLWARRWWPGCIWSLAIRATRSRHWKR